MMPLGKQLHAFADHIQMQEAHARGSEQAGLSFVGADLRMLADDAEQCPDSYGPAMPLNIAHARDFLADAMQAEIDSPDTQPARAEFLRRILGNVRKI